MIYGLIVLAKNRSQLLVYSTSKVIALSVFVTVLVCIGRTVTIKVAIIVAIFGVVVCSLVVRGTGLQPGFDLVLLVVVGVFPSFTLGSMEIVGL